MPGEKNSRKLRLARHRRVRKKVSGTPERPRLCIFRSLQHVYAQIIDDVSGHTLTAASTLDPEVRASSVKGSKTDMSKIVGAAIARKALEGGTTQVVFDRGGYKYHGRLKALADAAREGGLSF
jgi:large subunit ribosomal protein L18